MILPSRLCTQLMYRNVLCLVCLLGSVVALHAQAPVAYYPFNGNASDESGNGHNGNVNGATLIADRFGQARSAYLFDGNDFIAVAHSEQLVFGRNQGFTIGVWIRACELQDDFAGIVVKGPNRTLRPGYQLMSRNDSVLSSEISRNDGNLSRVFGNKSIITARWHFITLAVSSPQGTIRLYIDGVLDKADHNDGLEPDYLDTDQPLFIGKERNSRIFFKGAIDDVRIFDRMLNDAEILQLYQENGWKGGSGLSTVTTISRCINTPVELTPVDLLPPYRWNTGETSRSITVPGNGKYWVTGDIEVGCPRTDTFNVVTGNNIGVDAGNTHRICRDSTVLLVGTVGDPAGNYTYQWSPSAGLGSSTSAQTTASPRQTTRYYLMVTDSVGCAAIDSVTVVVDVLPEGRAGGDMVICAGEEVQIGRGPEPGENYTYRWITGEGFSATDIARPRVRPAATGIYVIEIRNAIGCTILDTMNITVNDSPRIDVGPDIRACTGEPVTIGSNASEGNGPYLYSWSPAAGLSSPSEAMPLASPTTPTRYIVTVTDANGCSVKDTILVEINPLPMGGAGADISICAGEEVEIGRSPLPGEDYSYRWISGDGLGATNIPRPQIRPTTGGEYILEITSGEGCSVLDTVVVQVNSLPLLEAGQDVRFCAGAAVRIGSDALIGNGPYRYLWSPATGLSSASEAMPLASPNESTRYIVTVTDANGCSAMDTVLVVVDAMPSGGAGSDMIICPGEEVEIGTTPSSGDAYSYEWISGEGLSSGDIARPRVRPTASSEYVVRIRNAAGCELLDTVVVQVSAPRVDVVSDISICSGDIVRIGAEATGGSGPYQYSWTPATGLSSTTEATPVANPTEPTLYTVIVTDARGCRDTASIMAAPAIARLAVASLLEGDELIFDPEIVANSFGAICDSVTLRNVSNLPLQLDAIALARNYYFSIPPSQLPFVIPASSERRLAICYLPHTSFDQFDTLMLAVDCGIALPIALRTNALYADDCNTPIEFRMAEKPTHFKAHAPYPNPAGGSATLRVERAAPSLQTVPQEQCRLYSSDGVEVASAVYAPESGWSRDGVSYERGVFSFATDHLPAGIYYVRIQSAGEIVSHPLLVTR